MAPDTVIGREKELAAVGRFFDREARGARGLLIEGDAGIGKTAVWREAVRIADASGTVLASRASKAEAKLSFAVLGDLLVPALNDDVLGALPLGQRRGLEVALLLAERASTRPDARAVSLAVLAVLRTLAGIDSVTIAVDDIQWVDPPSARALAFALRRLEAEPITVVAARRVEPGANEPLDLASNLPGGLERITLGQLDEASLGRLLRRRLGGDFPPPLVRKMHEASGGNPFFALEIGRALVAEDAETRPGEPLPVPVDLKPLLQDRLSALSDEARSVLLIAAASAHPTQRVITAAGGSAAGLEEAEAAGFVVASNGRIEFTHPLLSSTVYTSATERTRRDVHGQLAGIVADVEDRARHRALSIAGPDRVTAAALDRAADHAEARGAPEVASELWGLAAEATPADDVDALHQRRLRSAGSRFTSGDVAGARTAMARELERVGSGPRRARILHSYAVMSWNDVPRVMDLLIRSLDDASDDRYLRALVLAELAWASLWACDPAESIRRGDQALALAEEPDAVRFALAARATAGFVLGRDTTDLLQRGIVLDNRLASAETATPSTCLGWQQTWRGELDDARATLEGELNRYVDQGHETASWEVRATLAEVEFRAGRWDVAAAHAADSHEIVREAGWWDVLGQILPVRCAIAVARGHVEDARGFGLEALSLCERTGDRWDEMAARTSLGFLEASIGDATACRAWLEPVIERAREMDLRDPGIFSFVPDAVAAYVDLGELDEAGRLTDLLDEQGRVLGRSTAIAAAERCQGLVAAARRDLPEALSHLERAVEVHDSIGQPFERARTLLVLGETHRRLRAKQAARDHLQSALSIFEVLGAPLWANKARAGLERVGGRPPAPSELTPTEEQVAALVATGRTNREVAEALMMSVHTVDAHLRRVFRKLDVRSRTELARRL